jgi:CheY-like chemotaxis protein
MSTPRSIPVFVTFADKPTGKALKQIISEPIVFVNDRSQAEVIFCEDVREIENGFSEDMLYAYFTTGNNNNARISLPANVRHIKSYALADILAVLAEAKTRPARTPVPTPEEDPAVDLLPDALDILVIDDTPKHIVSAKKCLAGHRLTTVTGYQAAMDALSKEKFDVVLTDLHLPMSSKTMGDKFQLGVLVPYGILLMIEAARQGARRVAVVTDLNHHDDPFSAAFDHYSRFPISIEGATVRMLHARVTSEGKDWADALKRLE